MNIKEALKRQCQDILENTGYDQSPIELPCTADQAIEMYRLGILSVDDKSIKVMVYGDDLYKLAAFLETFEGPE